MSEIVELVNGYDRHKNPEVLRLRILTLEEVKALRPEDELWCACIDGKARVIRVDGQPKVWKRDPARVRVPWKYGLYDHGYITERNREAMALVRAE